MQRCTAKTKLLIIAGLAYAWVASDVRTFTRPAEALTGLPILVVGITLTRRHRERHNPVADKPARWLAGWAALVLVLFGWEMYELFSSPRHDYPTISSMGDAVLRSSRVTHALAFALWLAAGAYLARAARPVQSS
jgi:hypothetical protein